MAEQRDFIVDLSVDQRGAETYVEEMDRGAQQVRDIADRINRISLRGVRIAADGRGLSNRMRREAQRRRRDQERVISGMREVGVGLQKSVVREVGRGLQRPSARTGRLEAVTASTRNQVFSTANHRAFVGVGSFNWLLGNKQAGYALAIEGGSAATVGRKLTGLWFAGTGRPTGFGRPTKTQTFVVMRAREASKILVAAGRKTFRVSGFVHFPILAHEDYAKAVLSYQPQRRTIELIRRVYGTGS